MRPGVPKRRPADGVRGTHPVPQLDVADDDVVRTQVYPRVRVMRGHVLGAELPQFVRPLGGDEDFVNEAVQTPPPDVGDDGAGFYETGRVAGGVLDCRYK